MVKWQQEGKSRKQKKEPGVGDIVIYHCDSKTDRPLIVTSVPGEGVINGRVLLEKTEEDRGLPAIKDTQFLVPHDAESVFVEGVIRGEEEGQWSPRSLQSSG